MANPWIKAIRLRTLPLAWATLTMGAVLAHMDDAFSWTVYIFSVLTAFALQILSNLANDYGDAMSGIDGDNREGPSRTMQSGLITQKQMRNAIILMVLISLTLGVFLILVAIPQTMERVFFLALGIFSIAAAIRYTMGKNPYGYSGWGDLYVLIFFGWVGVGGSYYLFANSLNLDVFLPATTLGLMAVAVLNVNNIRDIESDKEAGKFSLPVRMGRTVAVVYHACLHVGALLSVVVFGILRDFVNLQWVFLLIVPLLILNWIGVKINTKVEKIDPFLKQMAITTLLFVVLFLVGNVRWL